MKRVYGLTDSLTSIPQIAHDSEDWQLDHLVKGGHTFDQKSQGGVADTTPFSWAG